LASVQRADAADLHRVNRQPQIVGGRCRRREVQDQIDLSRNVHKVRDVAADEPEVRVRHQVGDVGWRAGEEIVEAAHGAIRRQQPFAQVRAEKARSARDDGDRTCVGHVVTSMIAMENPVDPSFGAPFAWYHYRV
jgi:hypothetical protein